VGGIDETRPAGEFDLMAKEHFEALRQLRDSLVDERRELVLTGFLNPESRREAAAEFIGLQHFIDTVERAMAHEASLDGAHLRHSEQSNSDL
jgi:hypothetical protein